jgi:leader peptidase (prepilin peptidase) / N-methyltransferase
MPTLVVGMKETRSKLQHAHDKRGHGTVQAAFILHPFKMPTTEQILFILWFFVIGGVIGSFLNVVVYRAPRGLSLIHPPSHCPKCKRPIRWYDNVPIVGWLVLRGKCRDCGQAISPRYPAVELTTALTFAAMMGVEFAFEGINLPLRVVIKQPLPDLVKQIEIVQVINPSKADYFLIVLYHLSLLCVLFCGAMIEWDRARLPAKMYVGTMLAGLIFPLQWTNLRPMKAWPGEPAFMAGGTEGLCGLAAGGVLGYIVWWIGGKRALGFPLGIACVGVFLGWQAVLPVAIVAALLGVATAAIFPRKGRPWLIPASAALWISTFLWILFWTPLVHWLKLP